MFSLFFVWFVFKRSLEALNLIHIVDISFPPGWVKGEGHRKVKVTAGSTPRGNSNPWVGLARPPDPASPALPALSQPPSSMWTPRPVLGHTCVPRGGGSRPGDPLVSDSAQTTNCTKVWFSELGTQRKNVFVEKKFLGPMECLPLLNRTDLSRRSSPGRPLCPVYPPTPGYTMHPVYCSRTVVADING